MSDTPSQEIAPISPHSVENQPILKAVGESQSVVGSQEIKVFPAKRSSVRKHRLKPTQEAFIKHYTDPSGPEFGNGTRAYRKSHPVCGSDKAAAVGAYDSLRSPKVKEAVTQELEAVGFGKEEAIEGLVWNIRTSQTQGKLTEHREGTKVYLQATGNWKEVQEVTHLEDAQKDAIRRTVSEALGSN